MASNELANMLAKQLYGITVDEAHEREICISCKQDIKSMNIGIRGGEEWKITALCPDCFNAITMNEE